MVLIGLTLPQFTTTHYARAVQLPVEPKSSFCSCVEYVRGKGVDIPSLGEEGTPDLLKSNSQPIQGGAVLFSYGHIAYIEALLPKGMWVSEANKKPCEYTERFVPYDDPYIRGFYR